MLLVCHGSKSLAGRSSRELGFERMLSGVLLEMGLTGQQQGQLTAGHAGLG